MRVSLNRANTFLFGAELHQAAACNREVRKVTARISENTASACSDEEYEYGPIRLHSADHVWDDFMNMRTMWFLYNAAGASVGRGVHNNTEISRAFR
ncbi:unnamed protein product [Pleuronectes platessa]|uniref:Uncharacterized protein n=1 Tax=Pleuronectes platessa TaxID=8262 RepID=A0A9N7YXM6_PLEPL|nr:unnamed protein product [Pleuronectes platessa]